MTTDTEALRAQFEQYFNPDGDVNMHWLAAGFYAGTGVQQSWLDFQAGHAAAKAEAAMRAAAPTANAAPVAQGDARAEQALLKVLAAVQRYLPPDGPSAKDTLSEIIGIVDPWPLGDLKGKA